MTSVLTIPTATVPRLWPGETAVVIGGGSSLTAADVNLCRGRARVIAVKEAFTLAPWADVLYACDEKWWRHHKGVPEFAGLKYRLEHSPDEAVPFQEWPDVQILRNTGVTGLERDPSGLRTGYNSGYQAVNLAVHFGISRIVLLGFDMWPSPTGEQNWFNKPGLHIDSPYPLFLQAFSTIIEPLKAAGVQVVNASPLTMLRAFPSVDLHEAFG